jgi:hypothetical protein
VEWNKKSGYRIFWRFPIWRADVFPIIHLFNVNIHHRDTKRELLTLVLCIQRNKRRLWGATFPSVSRIAAWMATDCEDGWMRNCMDCWTQSIGLEAGSWVHILSPSLSPFSWNNISIIHTINSLISDDYISTMFVNNEGVNHHCRLRLQEPQN